MVTRRRACHVKFVQIIRSEDPRSEPPWMITKGKEPTVYLQFEVHTHERASEDYLALTR